MKRRSLFLVFLLMVLCCSGCAKEEEQDSLPVWEAFQSFTTEEDIIKFTVDEAGNLYTVFSVESQEDTIRSSVCKLRQYDTERTLVGEYEFGEDFSDIGSLVVKDQQLYFVTERKREQGDYVTALCCMDLQTKEVTVLQDLGFFDKVLQMVLIENRLYLLGNREYSVIPEETYYGDYAFYEDEIVYYELDTKELYELEIEKPVWMAGAEAGTLYVECYREGNVYWIMSYDAKTDALGTVLEIAQGYFPGFVLCNGDEDILYYSNTDVRGLMLSDLKQMDSEAEIYQCVSCYNLLQQNGTAYFREDINKIVFFETDELVQGQKVIRYISPGYQADAPYGCGYTMERMELDTDKFVLKVLAQDEDYDICLMNTLDGNSYNLKENGVFYPLNDIPGIEEYLDACFPYVKEAATKEDGMIWMLPISVYMPGMIVNGEMLAKYDISLSQEMTWEQFAALYGALTEQEKEKIFLSRMVLEQSFFQQYFAGNTSVDNEAFRKGLTALGQFGADMSLGTAENQEYLIYYARRAEDYTNAFVREAYYGESARVYPMPKQETSDANAATCIFLAVNPRSEHRTEALAFIRDWIAWQMMQEEKPVYFQTEAPVEGTFEADVYRMYQNGKIVFPLEEDVYQEGLEEVLNGTMNMESYIQSTEQRLKIYFGE